MAAALDVATEIGLHMEPSRSSGPSRQHKKRNRERRQDIMTYGYQPSTKNVRKYLNKASPVKTMLDTAELPVAVGAHTALNRPVPADASKAPDVQKLVEADGFQYIACGKNGYVQMQHFRKPLNLSVPSIESRLERLGPFLIKMDLLLLLLRVHLKTLHTIRTPMIFSRLSPRNQSRTHLSQAS
jgi:hypothetical protein